MLAKLRYNVAKEPAHARDHDWLIAVSLAARDHVIDRWSETTRRTYRDGRKRVYYFSLEFLIGRMLFDALSNLGLLSTFVGMLTDSRSFLSYTRHEYFRRILCRKLGREMEGGLLPRDFALVGGLVRDVSYRNAARYFGFGLPAEG